MLLKAVFHLYIQRECLQKAAALSYTSLLSLVPLFAVFFSVLSSLPVFSALVSEIQIYILNNFVPTTGDAVQVYLLQFIEKASQLTGIGLIVLLLTALMLMSTIDHVFNAIWQSKRRRKITVKWLVYIAVLVLGPIFLGTSILLTTYLESIPLLLGLGFNVEVFSGLMVHFLPFLLSVLALALLYVAVPTSKVALRHGLIGAIIAAGCFEIAKRGFVIYVTTFPTYSTIYGGLAVVPLFLLWIYISWLIVLLGAVVTKSLEPQN